MTKGPPIFVILCKPIGKPTKMGEYSQITIILRKLVVPRTKSF